jgi:hypothetical protein
VVTYLVKPHSRAAFAEPADKAIPSKTPQNRNG